MDIRLAFRLMMLPTLAGSMLTLGMGIERASAVNTSNAIAATSSSTACDAPSKENLKSSRIRHLDRGILLASAESTPDEAGILDFTEAESDAAVELFGCDCPSCLSALKDLRSQSLISRVNTNGHCWSSLQRNASPERVQEVIQNLETQE
ncbi:MAG: hypothetical protein KME17_30500 [Cyanosarcina radialis HA8281-LM2]|jgi:hypothetical protein|nr:hypothetical protein [Cyanosarcina radialis HA8281-LM2]